MRDRGFSLIELLIVVAIILIIAAIAIPSLVRSKIAANEASAVQNIRTLNTTETTFATMNPLCGYVDLTTLANSGLLEDNNLANGLKSGYTYNIVPSGGTGPTCSSSTNTPNGTHQITADPLSPYSGTRHFMSDPSGVIRFNMTTTATLNDSPI